MQFAIAVASGVVVGVVVLLATRARPSADGTAPTFSPVPGWVSVALGAIAATLLVASFMRWISFSGVSVLLLVGGAFASAIIGIGGVIRGDRHPQNWVGAVVGGAPALFWLYFAAAEVLFPH